MTTAQERLNSILPTWYELLTQWSLDGSLVAAATEALVLDGTNANEDAQGQLQTLVSQWSEKVFSALPPIVLLSDGDISGAQGAYAASTGTIYLNEEWLLTAAKEDIISVLTEEFGAFLDAQLNAIDTNGDEGALFSAELLRGELSVTEIAAIQDEDDRVQIVVDGSKIEAEASSTSLWITRLGGWKGSEVGLSDGQYISDQLATPRFSVSMLADGSSLVTGYFTGTKTFGSITLTSNGGADIFVVRLNSDGTIAWARNVGSILQYPVFDLSTSISTLADGTSFVSGYFAGTATFGKYSLTSRGANDAFLIKLSDQGIIQWAISAGGGGNAGGSNDYANAVAALSDGSSLIIGSFESIASFGTSTLTAAGGAGSDIFVAKINSDGSYGWINQYGRSGSGSGSESGIDIAVDGADGSSFITGKFEQTIQFGSFTLSAATASSYVAKLDSFGNTEWATVVGDFAVPSRISKASDSGVFITGRFSGTRSFGTTNLSSSGSDIFICKVSSSGQILWALNGGGIADDNGIAVESTPDGGCLITGYFKDIAIFGNFSLASVGANDIFVAKISSTGSYEWAIRAGGLGNDCGTGLSQNGDGSYLLTGEFEDLASFGQLTIASAGGRDNFTTRLSLDGTWSNLSLVSSAKPLQGPGGSQLRYLDYSEFSSGYYYNKQYLTENGFADFDIQIRLDGILTSASALGYETDDYGIFASSNSSRTGFWIQSPVSDARTELFLDLGTAETTGDGYFIINAFTLSNGTIQFVTPNDGLGGRDLYFGYAIDTSTSVVDPNIDLDNNINSGVWQISPNPAYGGTFFSGTSGLISTYLPIFDQVYSNDSVLFGYSQIKSRKGYAITLDTPAATPFFISNSTGSIYSDASTASWDAKGARAFGTGYQVLLDGTGTYAGKGLVWTTNSAGVITGSSGWLSAERLWQWESAFGVELNDDGTTGYAAVDVVGGRLVRPIGAVYGGTYYIDRDGDVDTDDLLKLRNSEGVSYRDSSSGSWDAKGARAFGTGYQVLLDGTGTYAGKGLVWTTNSAGVITGSSGWLSAERLWQWESAFGVELNDDGTTGYAAVDVVGGRLVRPIGAVYGGTYYIDRDGDVDTDDLLKLRNSEGVSYRDSSSGSWDAKGARAFGTGYQVLLDGTGAYEGQGLVWTTNSAGVITGSSGWLSAERLWQWESAFGVELNNDGSLGEPNQNEAFLSFWRNFALFEAFGTHYLDIDSPKDLNQTELTSIAADISTMLFASSSSASTGQYSLSHSALDYDLSTVTGGEYLLIYELNEFITTNFLLPQSGPVRLQLLTTYQDSFYSGRDYYYDYLGNISVSTYESMDSYQGLALFVGTLSDFAQVRANISFAASGEVDYAGNPYLLPSYNDISYQDNQGISITMINEALLFGNTGLQSIGRQAANDASARIFMKTEEYGKTSNPSPEATYSTTSTLTRSIKIGQSSALNQWFADGIFLVETFETATDAYYSSYFDDISNTFISVPGSYSYNLATVFTQGGALLGFFEQDGIEYEGDTEAFDTVESGHIGYKSSDFLPALQSLFPESWATFEKANSAPLFVGFDGTTLGFDLATGLPDELFTETPEQDIRDLFGSKTSLIADNQVFVALGACDIITGFGSDLVILADDISNNDESLVPRILDFDVSADQILLPIDTFSSFQGNSPGAISSNLYTAASQATTASQRIVYDSLSGHLFYDSDGLGGIEQEMIAYFENKPQLTPSDFILG